MGAVINTLNVLGWGGLLSLIVYKFAKNPTGYYHEDITLQVGLVTLLQTFQILDIIMILVGKSKGSLFGSIAQITGRMIVAWIFLEEQTDRYSFALMASMWCIADMTRYLYYLAKNDITLLFRYNLFTILYPVGVYGEMKVINNYIKRHSSSLTIDQISMIRLVQASIIIGTVFLYFHMFKLRSKYFGFKPNFQKLKPNKQKINNKTD